MKPEHQEQFNSTPDPVAHPPGVVFQPGVAPEPSIVAEPAAIAPLRQPTPPSVAPVLAAPAMPLPDVPPVVPITPAVVGVAHPQRGRWMWWTLLALVGVIIMAAATYAFYVRPALGAYHRTVDRVTTATSLRFAGSLQFYGQDFLAAYDSKLNFSGAVARPPNASPAGQLEFAGSWAKRNYIGRAQLQDSRLNFRLVAAQMPVIRYQQSTILVPLASGQTYSLQADASLWDNVCENRTPASLASQLELYRQFKTVKLTPSWLINPYARYNGQSVVHLRGQVPPENLTKLMTAVQQALPAGCSLSTLGFTASDLGHMPLGYQIWTNPTDDWLELQFEDKALGSKLIFSLHGNNYNEPVQIPAPSGTVVDLNAQYAKAVKATGLIPYGGQ